MSTYYLTFRIENEIAKSYYHGEHLSCIFVSHFDKDHINGLNALEQNYKIDNNSLVFVPFFYREVYVYLGLYKQSYLEGLANFESFILRTKAHLVRVNPYHNGDKPSDESYYISSNTDGNKFPDVISSSTTLIIVDIDKKPIWKYVPFNITNDSTIEDGILEKYRNIGAISPDNHFNLDMLKDKKKIKALRDCFSHNGSDNLSDIINRYSLQLLSFPVHPNSCINYYRQTSCEQYLSYYNSWPPYHINEMYKTKNLYIGSCLYTGDVFTNNAIFWQVFNQIITDCLDKNSKGGNNRLVLFQIPHHGSIKNNDKNIANQQKIYSAFLSYNSKYKNKPFNSNFINQFSLVGKPLIHIQENAASRFEEIYFFNE